MTIAELKKKITNYDAIEVYEYQRPGGPDYYPHADYISRVNEYNDQTKLCSDISYVLMGEKEYDNTILANTKEKADFMGRFGRADAKVLVILVD